MTPSDAPKRAADDTTDPNLPRPGTDPDLHIRPVIEGDDPLASGGWHTSGNNTKATVVQLDDETAPEGPNTLLEAEPPPMAVAHGAPRVAPEPPGLAARAPGPRLRPELAHAPTASAEIEVVRSPGVPVHRVLALVSIVAALAFVLGRLTA
jgi:hypothetical protein